MSFKDCFSKVAPGYASYRPTYPPPLFEWLAGIPARRELAWDCACGSGQATLSIARFFRRVIATDASAEQIKVAPRDPTNIEWRVARAEQSGLDDESVDLLTVAQAVHWFDFASFYREAHRALRRDGAIALWTYGINLVEGSEANALVYDFYANVVGPFWPPERRLVEEEYRTIPFPFVEIHAPRFSMTSEWNMDQLLGYFRTWSATTRCIAETGADPVLQLEEKLAPVWGPRDRARLITWPLTVRVGRKS